MPDIQELSDNDMSIAQRMAATLSDEVLFGEETEDKKAGQQREDDTRAPDEIQDGPEASQEDAKAKTEADEQKAAEDADPEFEIPDPNGGEAHKHKLSELVEAHRELTAFNEEKTAIISRIQDEAIEQAQGYVQQTQARVQDISTHLEAVLQHIRPPQKPNAELMLNPNSPQYDPDGYHRAVAAYDGAMTNFNFVREAAAGLKQKQDDLKSAREDQELRKLRVFWPEFVDAAKAGETQRSFAQAMNKEYGFTGEELDAALQNHRYILAARDALKWREHQASQSKAKATIKEKVVAKIPAKTAATEAGKRTLTTEQSQHMNARKALLASGGKDINAASRGMMRFLD